MSLNLRWYSTTGVYSRAPSPTGADEIDQDANSGQQRVPACLRISEDRYSLDGIEQPPRRIRGADLSLGTNSFYGAEDGLQVMTYYDSRSEPLEVYGDRDDPLPMAQCSVGGFIVANILDTADVFAATPVLNNPLVESETYDLRRAT